MKAILEVAKSGSAVRAAREQVAESRRGKSPDFRLSFESAKSLFADLTPARVDLMATLRRVGPCSVYALAKAAERNYSVSQEVLQKELWLPDGTTNALEMVKIARRHGVKARGVKVPDKKLLSYLPVGSIVYREGRRFQVLEKIAGDRVTVLDPFDGQQILPIDNFWTHFRNVALLFE